MVTMTLLPQSRPLTVVDLEALPDDGHRYELIDGTLLVTPAPTPRHQLVVAGLYRELFACCPDELVVLFAPLDVVLDQANALQPDLLVARRTDLTSKNLSTVPLLAVEVLSPSTRLIDLNLKRARYEAASCRSYWAVDPDEPSLTAWELREGRYVEASHASAAETFSAQLPYPVQIVPQRLID
jgi:Uma2 family endonuclease